MPDLMCLTSSPNSNAGTDCQVVDWLGLQATSEPVLLVVRNTAWVFRLGANSSAQEGAFESL